MNQSTTEKSMPPLHEILPWLVEMGADEIILEQPVNRLAGAAAELTPAQPKPQHSASLPTGASREAAPVQQVQAPRAWASVAAGEEGPALAEKMAAACTSIDDIVSALSALDAHPLKKTATQLCFLGGDKNGRILVLSDRPRNDEDATGEVLAAKNQVLAERMLAAIGLCGAAARDNAEQVMLANFVPWRPPGNRAILENEARMCLPFVRRLIELSSVEGILCLGPLAGQYLAGGEEAIMRARGKWHMLSIGRRSIPLLTTFHPDTLLKAAQSKRLAWHDLQAFHNKLATGGKS